MNNSESTPAVRWYSLRGLTTVVTTLFIALGSILVLGALSFGSSRWAGADSIDIDDFPAIVQVVILGMFLTELGLMMTWTHHALSNTGALRPSARHFKPGWGIGGLLLPVVPWLMFLDLWRGSNPDRPREEQDLGNAPGTWLVAVWGVNTIGFSYRGTGVLGFVACVYYAGASIVFIATLRLIAVRQERCRRAFALTD
jgi:hypothetical protein